MSIIVLKYIDADRIIRKHISIHVFEQQKMAQHTRHQVIS